MSSGIQNTSPLTDMHFLHTFLQYVASLLIFTTVFYAAETFNFGEAQFINFFLL